MKRMLVLAVLMICLTIPAAFAADDVKLEYKVPSAVVTYLLSSDAKSVFSLYGLEKLIVQNSETTFTCAAQGSGPDVPLRLTVTDQLLTSDGMPVTDTEKGRTVDLTLKANGVINQSSDVSTLENFQDLILSFPDHPVKVGDKWTNEVPMQMPDGQGGMIDAKARIECELQEVKPFKNAKKCAVISSSLVIAPNKSETAEMKARAEGKIFFDVDKGMMIMMKNELGLTLTVYKQIQGKNVLFTSLDLKMVNTLTQK